ncbi:hypothetical protein H0H93_002899, partial [Arthromyces matolae]
MQILPSFIPTLAQGGGAEVLPFNSTWFVNNNNASSNGYYSPTDSIPFPMISAPSSLGLPVYSASGFDILSILSRVASRPNPTVLLGPVDMTCSFVVVDIRRHDFPIVYCSPSFCRLTGYQEHEVLGKNCRFLQAPPGSPPVSTGEPRRFTSQASVDTMRKAVIANKEVQTSIVNFRKDGSAFINLISIIPILGGERGAKHELNDIVYHVGFQVDLTEQPSNILNKIRDGSYAQNLQQQGIPSAPSFIDSHYLNAPSSQGATQQTQPDPPPQPPSSLPPPLTHRKQQLPAIHMAPSLSQALANPALHRALPITTCTTAPSPLPASTTSSSNTTSSTVGGGGSSSSANSPLSLLLLEYSPDFILVVSLKGAFLYVAPAVSRILGHSPISLVGRSISDLAHPEDVVPLERQLKESSTLISSALSGGEAPSPTQQQQPPPPHHHHHHHAQARLIDILFRARTAGGSYVWVEARGRLHVEPGKGRKAIILSARARRMPFVRYGDILPPLPLSPSLDSSGPCPSYECWTTLSGSGRGFGAFVSIGSTAKKCLGYEPEELMGRRVPAIICEEDKERLEDVLEGIDKEREGYDGGRVVVFVRMRLGGTDEEVRVRLAFYPTRMERDGGGWNEKEKERERERDKDLRIAKPVVLLQIARGEGIDLLNRDDTQEHHHHDHDHDDEENFFEELEVRRGSSWQYALQQLRFQNSRLREEVQGLEKELAGTTSTTTFEGESGVVEAQRASPANSGSGG